MKREAYLFKKGYRITTDGKIINPKGKILNGYLSNLGYMIISFKQNSITKTALLHRLQAFQKYGMKLYDKGMEARHLNGDSLDNSYENIAIGTHSQNMMDIPKADRMRTSLYAASFLRKYNKEEVRKHHADNGNSYKKTMACFGITSKGTLHYILNK